MPRRAAPPRRQGWPTALKPASGERGPYLAKPLSRPRLLLGTPALNLPSAAQQRLRRPGLGPASSRQRRSGVVHQTPTDPRRSLRTRLPASLDLPLTDQEAVCQLVRPEPSAPDPIADRLGRGAQRLGRLRDRDQL